MSTCERYACATRVCVWAYMCACAGVRMYVYVRTCIRACVFGARAFVYALRYMCIYLFAYTYNAHYASTT